MVSRLQAFKEVILHKITSMIIGMTVCALFGVPLLQNIAIAITISTLTITKDYLLRRYFYKKALKNINRQMEEVLAEQEEFEASMEYTINMPDPYIEEVLNSTGPSLTDLDMYEIEALNSTDLDEIFDMIDKQTKESKNLKNNWKKTKLRLVKNEQEDEDE